MDEFEIEKKIKSYLNEKHLQEEDAYEKTLYV